jgi:hypothetical protein
MFFNKTFWKGGTGNVGFWSKMFFFLGFGGLRRSGKQMNETKTIS